MRNRIGRLIDWLFRDRRTGRIVIAQTPNAPLIVFLVVSVLRRVVDPEGTVDDVSRVVEIGSLLWWAADEVLRGVNPFRRLLGAVVATATIVGLALT